MKKFVPISIVFLTVTFGCSGATIVPFLTDGVPYATPPAGWGYQVWNGGTNDLYFDLRGNTAYFRCGSAIERADSRSAIVIDGATGNVGINAGQLTPHAKLDVQGDTIVSGILKVNTIVPNFPATTVQVNGAVAVIGILSAKEVKVTVNGFPDYVFNADYKLMSLKELEASIKKEGHLPGVQSAKEVEKTGLELSEISKTQMRKIEELTLYVIQLKNENDALKSNVQSRLVVLEMLAAKNTN